MCKLCIGVFKSITYSMVIRSNYEVYNLVRVDNDKMLVLKVMYFFYIQGTPLLLSLTSVVNVSIGGIRIFDSTLNLSICYLIKTLLQMGRVVEGPADFYHSRIPKKQRKATLVDELMADAEFRK